ncbi:MAG: S4 domain-containing protein, partial [Planctomycetota bacterium]|nr:S4 domain-containing protein [Planctomycetota bacterium]
KLNFASSRKAARQLIAHGHIYLNGRKVDIADITVRIGDKITLKASEKSKKRVREQLEVNPNFTTQGWLQLDISAPAATVIALPSREDVQLVIEEQLVVEFCSR